MDLDDFFKHKGHRKHHDHRYFPGSHEDRKGHYASSKSLYYLFEKIKNNKKFIVMLSITAIILVVLAVIVIIMFIPLIIKTIDLVQQGGVKGIIDSAIPILERLWSGSGK